MSMPEVARPRIFRYTTQRVKDKIKKILNKPVWGKAPVSKSAQHAEEIARLKAQLKEAASVIGTLKGSLKSCWRISRHCECGEKVTEVVISALAEGGGERRAAKKTGGTKK